MSFRFHRFLNGTRCGLFIVLLGIALIDAGAQAEQGPDPAARPNELPVRGGLILWVDAAAQAGARQSASLPAINHLQPVDLVVDTSTHARIAIQADVERRPIFVAEPGAGYFKFDGKDDSLLFSGGRRSSEELTVFILAAPKGNGGGFSGLFSAAALGKNDYTSGLNFDFGPNATKEISVLNVESVGATGFRDLLVPGFLNAMERPFRDFHVFTARSKAGKAGTEVFMDGFKGGERERAASKIALDQIAIGSRLYSNDPAQAPYVQGSFDGALAEVLVYDRALSEEERQAIEQFLLAKTVRLNALLHGAKGHALEAVKNPPVVQMLVPGFVVEELPLKLSNLNNVRYRHDGKLVGLGYDGRIHLLTDTDGDGLEDMDEIFWDKGLRSPIGMALTEKNDPRGDGIIVASKGKVSLILDKDRDGKGDEEKVLASGWPDTLHNVNTLGLAVDPTDGAIYFGLGCANFVEAYLIDKTTAKAGYNLQDIRGTIQRISPDFAKQETVCTGVRFTCALAFNRAGDLFATDQEGATWLANGNPLDELLHIEKGKHYGFPPRHPKHLPEVIDEPPVSEFGPQHQSTVGMVFNEGVNGGPTFGPKHWAGDALICGESRGKLWRTRLARTPLGYVAQNHLIACLSLLTIDSCVSPSGDLVVACHSGPPDWGTGPAGDGRLFRIRYNGTNLPQPVLAWAAAADEFRIAFDRPLDPADWAHSREAVKIEAGRHVSAGDRFEVIRPGYQVVRDQMAMPRRWVDVLGLTLTEDRRTIVLRVPRQTEPVTYAISLPVPKSWKQGAGGRELGVGSREQGKRGIAQHEQIDVQLTLNGLAATVSGGSESQAAVSTILPHSSLSASAVLTTGSAEHEAFFQRISAPDASLGLRGLVDASNPYVPAVQPGSKLDWDMASDPFVTAPFAVRSDYATESSVALDGTGGRLRMVQLASIKRPQASANGLFLSRDPLKHSLSTTRLFVPWTREQSFSETNAIAKARTDVKGNWLRGRRVFYGEGGCVTCHTIRGVGTGFGPDLSNLIHRDRESVVQDILQPSSTINPDQAGTLVTLKDGTAVSGILRSLKDDTVALALPAGAHNDIRRSTVASIEPMKLSLMPAGLGEVLDATQMEDLLTFLLVNPLEPAPITRPDPPIPPARTVEEIEALLSSAGHEENPGSLRILLCAGPKDHGVDEHDYPLWLTRWSGLLALADKVEVATANGFPTAEQLSKAAVAVFYNANPGWSLEKAALVDEFHRRGGGAVYLHYAVEGGKEPAAVAERMGLAFTLGSKFRHGEFDLVFPQPEHPITRGFPTLHFTDETYWNMRGEVSRLNLLGTAVEEGAPRPIFWTLERERSRIVACIPGHYTWTFDDPYFRVLVLRSICWAAKQKDVDRLGELATVGARMRGR